MVQLLNRLPFWFLVIVTNVSCGHDIVRRDDPTLLAAEYAVLTVSRFHLSLLLDIEHNLLTVRDDERATCCILNMTNSQQSALHLVVHIFRQGGRVLESEFGVDREVGNGWMRSQLGSQYSHFCLHLRVLLLQPAQGKDVIGTTTQGLHPKPVSPDLIG
ncbi:uncharacterized protein [Littorina saxatilis]|uniref:uncharacterized protein n=1 Tax=Littorina saxatilis TaxID=31220 RepID=UPI0038B5C1F9